MIEYDLCSDRGTHEELMRAWWGVRLTPAEGQLHRGDLEACSLSSWAERGEGKGIPGSVCGGWEPGEHRAWWESDSDWLENKVHAELGGKEEECSFHSNWQLTFSAHFPCAGHSSGTLNITHLIFTTTQWGRYYYYTHFTDEKSNLRHKEVKYLAQGHTASTWCILELNLESFTLNFWEPGAKKPDFSKPRCAEGIVLQVTKSLWSIWPGKWLTSRWYKKAVPVSSLKVGFGPSHRDGESPS